MSVEQKNISELSPDRARMLLSVPSKTFLMGEYAVLQGMPAVILAHGPRFHLTIENDGVGACEGIHPQSPAGRFIRANAKKFSKVSISFKDAHNGRGGFGASSAQFILSYAWTQMGLGDWAQIQNVIDPKTMWQTFRDLHSSEPQLPSGGDIMAQTLGLATTFQTMPWQLATKAWPFANLAVILIPTGVKVATHEHLRERLPLSDALLDLAKQGADAFAAGQSEAFLSAFRNYGEELERLQLLTATSRGLIAQVASVPEVLAVKGCGALGADVLAVMTRPEHLQEVQNILSAQGLKAVATSNDLQSGLRLEMELSPYQVERPQTWV